MYECPHCQQPGMSLMRKMTLGPARSTRCQSCRQELSVPPASLALLAPFVVALLLARALPLGWGVVAVTAGIVILFAGWHRVPLIKK